MEAVLQIAKGVPCHACGAVLAPAGHNEFGLCSNCWTKAISHCGGTIDLRRKNQHKPARVTENGVNGWLAHKLVQDIRRLTKTGMVGRCEAVSNWTCGNPGTQCASPAVGYRDGHKVCFRHGRARAPVFVSDAEADHYVMFREIIRQLAAADPRFRTAIEEAL